MPAASLASRRFLPPGTSRILGRRSAELLGLGAAFLGLGLLVALASHAPTDPSFNTATGAPARNLAGPAGAFAADLLLQGFGAAGTLPGLVLLAWAWRLLAHRGLARPLLRLAALLAALPLAAGLLELAPLGRGMGGVAGVIVANGLVGRAEQAFGAFGLAAAGGALGLGAVLSVIAALGMSGGDWRSARDAASAATADAVGRARASRSWLARLLPRRDLGARAEPAAARHGEPRLEPELAHRREPARADESQATPGEPPRRTRIEASLPPPAARPRAPLPRQAALDLGGYTPPPIDLLAAPPRRRERAGPDEAALEANARLLEGVLADFGVRGAIVNIRPGPVVTMYELEPAPGTKSARVIGLADDIARSMSAISVRVATVPGRNVLGIELPNTSRETVYLSEMLSEESFGRDRARLNLALGKDIGGAPVVVDLARMPHLLIAGTTGSGKSVAINTMILSLLYRLTPEECRFVMIDPKMLELSVYEGIPHLLSPVVTEPAKAVAALKWTVREMERRYRAMSQIGVRNIAGFNARVAEARSQGEVLTRRVQTGFDPETSQPVFEEQPLALEPLPFIVVVVDEMADLMIVAGKEIEAAVQRLAQMARAAGIHIIMATQRPSVDVITGTIKANFPTRVSFQVTSRIDSRTILGEQGAEQLLGQGDMLYMAGGGRISRVHGPFVTDREVEAIVSHLRAQGTPDYVEEVTESAEEDDAAPALFGEEGSEGGNALYDQAVALVVREGKASTSFLQRHLQLGYNRAAKLIEAMEKEGVVGPANHVGKREVLARRPRDDER